jgi:hypothetical protein
VSQDERWRLMEEAFSKIEPKNEAEREKLERMKERMRAISEEAARDLEKHREQMDAFKSDHALFKEAVHRRDEVMKQTREALPAGLEEQADLIERIVKLSQHRA